MNVAAFQIAELIPKFKVAKIHTKSVKKRGKNGLEKIPTEKIPQSG